MTAPGEKPPVAIVGASGYVGGELLRLLAHHPSITLTRVTSEKSAGVPVAQLFPHLRSIVPHRFEAFQVSSIADQADVVFLALPHTQSMTPAAALLKAGKTVIDLSADYRLKDPDTYQRWYGTPHSQPNLLRTSVYGIPELHRNAIRQARLVASPGCYPTAAILQLAPLAAAGLIQPGSIIIDAKSGLSGAGRSPALPFHFPEANESVEAYKIGSHRHIPEIEQELTRLNNRPQGASPSHSDPSSTDTVSVTFTPHLVPMNRGILSTAYCQLVQPLDTAALTDLYKEFYEKEGFVRVLAESQAANPRHVRGSNYCDIAVQFDPRSNRVISTAALDNLVKGAAGQAIQAMNLILGFPETLGLQTPALFP